MNAREVIEVIQMLSYSQGFYGRLLRDIKNFDAEQMREFIDFVEAQNFQSSIDVILFFEC